MSRNYTKARFPRDVLAEGQDRDDGGKVLDAEIRIAALFLVAVPRRLEGQKGELPSDGSL